MSALRRKLSQCRAHILCLIFCAVATNVYAAEDRYSSIFPKLEKFCTATPLFCSTYTAPEADGPPPTKYRCLAATTDDFSENIFTPSPTSPQSRQDEDESPSPEGSINPPTPQQWAFNYDAMPSATFVCFNPPGLGPYSLDDELLPPSPFGLSNSHETALTDDKKEQEDCTPSPYPQSPESQVPESVTFTIVQQAYPDLTFVHHLHERKLSKSPKINNMMAASLHDGKSAKVLIFQAPETEARDRLAYWQKTNTLYTEDRLSCKVFQWDRCLKYLDLESFLIDEPFRPRQTIQWADEHKKTVPCFLHNRNFCLPFNTNVSWVGPILPDEQQDDAIILTPYECDILRAELERLACSPQDMPENSAIVHLYKVKQHEVNKVRVICQDRWFNTAGYTNDIKALMSSQPSWHIQKTSNLWCLFHNNTLIVVHMQSKLGSFEGKGKNKKGKNKTFSDICDQELTKNDTRLKNTHNIINLRNTFLEQMSHCLSTTTKTPLFSVSCSLFTDEITKTVPDNSGLFFARLDNVYFIPGNRLFGSWISPATAPLEPFWTIKIDHLITPEFTEHLATIKDQQNSKSITILEITQDE